MKEMVKNLNTIIENRNENWKFHLGECEEAWYKGFDDSQWRSVRLPHDWSVEIPFSKEYSSGTGYAAGGVGWYRLRFTLPKEYEGKCIRVVFDGIYKNSQVWCNSYYLGKRPNGYTTFSYDLTSFLCFGEEMDNEISVKVNHTDIADSRWFTGSGITRKVTFLIEEKVHPKEYGIFFQTKQMNRDAAQIES
ncbi:sugar-binding domain-containing protein [Robinsoniella peoriensis]|uniref:sugar-binding domain-containing protein n=1 Tax=Robinsoniella peoriensis TaxID=180332 RepID=UPI0037514A6B